VTSIFGKVVVKRYPRPAVVWNRDRERSLAKAERRRRASRIGSYAMGLGTILLIVLILLLVGALPSWGYSRNWGYLPSGGLGLVLVIVLILVLMGRI
jgi:uncharacterized membrane protein YkgB